MCEIPIAIKTETPVKLNSDLTQLKKIGPTLSIEAPISHYVSNVTY